MIVEVFLLKDKEKKPDSVMVELTPENLKEEDSLRNAKILHKNNIMVYWGDTVELGRVRGSITQRKEEEETICMDGLKISFKLPKEQKPMRTHEEVIGYCVECGKPLDAFITMKLDNSESNACKKCLMDLK